MNANLVTLITGASSGAGRQIAVSLSRSRRLVLHGRDAGRLIETRELCERPAEHLLWNLDLRQGERIEVSLTQFIEDHGLAVEGFVHCAGALKVQPLRLVERGWAHEIMEVNVMSALEIVRLLVRRKLNDRHLRGVVLVSSTASQFGARGFSVYCASKGALDAFMRAAAVELAPDIRVNSVLPGALRTAMTESMLDDDALKTRMEAQYPLGIGEPGDIAAAVEFLLSDKARWITGQQLVVDGGRTVNLTA
ncbi:MAG TPA: SDR family oxidoreductase [Steroidobacteraceae bacterium]|nr:SDR family oxidoreductase [Steroidobacteraceae bacterium]